MQQNQQLRSRMPFFQASSTNTTMSSTFFTPRSNQHTLEKERFREKEQNKENEHIQTGERLTGLHARLQQEAEKIRRWKTQTECELKNKDQRILESHQTIESLRKSALELQLENENLSQKLQEEMMNREEIVEKINATRNMCSLLKDYAAKLDDRLQKCETEKTELKYMEMEHKREFEDLTEKFQQLDIETSQKYEKLENELCSEKNEKKKIGEEFKEKLISSEQQLMDLVTSSNEKEVCISNITRALEENEKKTVNLEMEYESLVENLKMKDEEVSAHKENLQQASTELNEYKNASAKLESQIDEITNRLQESLTNKDKMARNFDETEKLFVSKINTMQAELETATSDREKSTDRIQELETMLTDSKNTIEDLKCAKDMLILERTEANERVKSLETEKALLSARVEELEQEMSQLNGDNVSYTDEIMKLKENMQDLQSNRAEKEKEIENYIRTISDKESHMISLTENLENKKEQYEQLQEELKEFQLSEKALTEQLDIVKTQLANESKEYQTVLEKLTQLNKDKKTLQGDFSTKNKELNKVQKELEKTKSKETGACSKVDSLTDELEEMKNCLADLEVKLKEENEEHAKLLQEEKAKVKNLKKDLTAKNKVSNNLEGKSNSLQNQLEKLKAELEERKSENTTLTSEVKSLKENLANKDKQIVELNDNVKESDEKIKRLETEKEGINAHCDSELRRMGDLMDRFKANKDKFIIQQRETIEKLNNQLDIMKCQEQTTNLLKSENENYESEVKVLKEEKDQWKKDQEESKEKQELLENEIKEKDEKIESLSAANMCSNNQIKKLEEEIEELKIKVKTVTDNTSATPSVPVESSSPKDKDSNDLETLLTTNTPAFSKPVPCTPSIRRAPPFTDVLVKRTPRQKIEATNRTPQTNNRGILRMANTMSATKKRRVIFASDLDSETSQSSSDVMEIELNDLEMRLKNKSGRSTPLIVKPSPKVQTASLFSSPASSQKSKIPLKPVRRTPNINAKKAKTEEESELEKFRMLFPEKSKEFSEKKTSPGAQRTNVRKTPCRVGGKFFKNSTTEKKKTTKSRLKSDSNDLAWFENDAVFGFGPED